MNSVVREHINDVANAVRSALEISGPIDDMDKIVSSMGIKIENVDYLPEFADAKLEKNGNKFVIKISEYQSLERRRFTLAHELGHMFLHINNNTTNEEFYRSFGGEKEYEAHEFAAAFLMPQEQFTNEMIKNYNNGYYDMNKVAEYFKVSVSAAMNRGKWLGLLSWE